MRACTVCRGPNTTLSGLCVACQVWAATRKAMASHEAAQRMRAGSAVPIRPNLYRDPATIPLRASRAGKGEQSDD